jgi:glycosyltransferase involved in cell wall biosynthesis
MKFGALLGVMDEVELLPRCLEHLYRIGVDRVVARDGGSTDGSLELLRSMAGERLTLVELGEDEKRDPDICSTREAEDAQAIDADWILFLDADEFWLPASGSLHDGPQWHDTSIDVIQVPRYNVALVPAGPLAPATLTPEHHDALWMFARAIPNFRRHLQERPLTPWITGVPVAKFAARPGRLGIVEAGWHGVQGQDGAVLTRQPARDVIAAHLPFTTASRFAQKVANIRRMFATYPDCFPPNQAWHWRRWAELASDEAVRNEFELQCLSDAETAALRDDGTIRNAHQLLQALA